MTIGWSLIFPWNMFYHNHMRGWDNASVTILFFDNLLSKNTPLNKNTCKCFTQPVFSKYLWVRDRECNMGGYGNYSICAFCAIPLYAASLSVYHHFAHRWTILKDEFDASQQPPEASDKISGKGCCQLCCSSANSNAEMELATQEEEQNMQWLKIHHWTVNIGRAKQP